MQPECEIWLDNQLLSALAKLMQAEWKIVVKSAYILTQYGCPPKIIKFNTGNLPTKLLWNKYGKNFKSAIKLLLKTKAEIIFIE